MPPPTHPQPEDARQSGQPACQDGRPGSPLSPRERQVTLRVAYGDSNVEIAARLWLSPRTVQSHVAAARRKLGARNRTHLAVLAIAQGIVPLPNSTKLDARPSRDEPAMPSIARRDADPNGASRRDAYLPPPSVSGRGTNPSLIATATNSWGLRTPRRSTAAATWRPTCPTDIDRHSAISP